MSTHELGLHPPSSPGRPAPVVPPVLGPPTSGRPLPDPAEFVETALHDLRAPLRNIRQAMEWLAEHLGDSDGTTREYLGIMREATDRIDALTGSLGMLGRVECHELDAGAWTIDDLADEAAARVRGCYPAPWTLVVEEPRTIVVGDRDLVVSLLETLFANAVEYRNPVRRLVVVVRVDGTGPDAVIDLTDNGIGMDARYQDLVTEPFRRLHTRQEHPGSGLGLTIAECIARRHGGRLLVRSVPDESTTVRFSLSPTAPPLAGPHAPPANPRRDHDHRR